MEKKLIDQFNTNGFLLLKGLFETEKISELRNDALYIFSKQVERITPGLFYDPALSELDKLQYLFDHDFSAFVQSGKQAQHLISLHRLSLSERIENILIALGLNFPSISTRPVLYFNHERLAKEKVYHTVFAHQDWRSMQGSINSTVCWLPLVNVTKALGALQVVPGSHLKGLLTEEVDHGFGKVIAFRDEDFIDVEVEVGDALFFNSFLVHKSGNNILNQIRWSCHFRYNDLNEKTFIERGYPHPYIYKPSDELLNPDFDTKKEIQRYSNLA